jgi:hypothetical protein
MESRVIAERVYYLEGKAEEPAVHLRMYSPICSVDDYPACRYDLCVGGVWRSKQVSNVDTIGCISLCLIVAGTEIAGLNESLFEGKLRWEAWRGGDDIGLPTLETAPETRDSYAEALRWSSEQKAGGPSSNPSEP